MNINSKSKNTPHGLPITTSRSSPNLRSHIGDPESRSQTSSTTTNLETPQPTKPFIRSLFSLHLDGQPTSTSISNIPSSPSSSETDTPLHRTFSPPFYNRPPTPLPPSPSLSLLLRPPPLLPNSHPTTPDSSDSELISTSSRIAQATRASPRVPTYEYYGFVLYLISTLTFGMYIIWSYAPSSFLHGLGIHYYPSRWWSLALPSWLVIAVVYIYVALGSYNTGYLTRGLQEVEGIVDGMGKIAVKGIEERSVGRTFSKSGSDNTDLTEATSGVQRDWKRLWNKATDGVIDVPLGGVCEVLYGEGRENEDWELELELELELEEKQEERREGGGCGASDYELYEGGRIVTDRCNVNGSDHPKEDHLKKQRTQMFLLLPFSSLLTLFMNMFRILIGSASEMSTKEQEEQEQHDDIMQNKDGISGDTDSIIATLERKESLKKTETDKKKIIKGIGIGKGKRKRKKEKT